MATLLCDLCGGEPAKYMVGDMDTGTQQAMGQQCFALVGFQVTMAADDDYVDGLLKQLGYGPTKALRDSRKAGQLPEVDATRTIVEIVETQPRPPGDESPSGQADESPDPQVDNSTNTLGEGSDECPVCGDMIADSEQEKHFLTEHADAPPY